MKIRQKGDRWDITIPKCDSGYVTVVPTTEDGAALTMGDSDTVHIQVREKPSDELLFDGDVYPEVNEETGEREFVWHIHPADTAEAGIKTYYWDAQVEYGNGDTFTFIGMSEFKVTDEVTKRP